MKSIEIEGKTVTMAVEKGLAELGLRRDQVEVQVLQEANPGFLGIGAKTARVRISEKIWEGSEGARAAETKAADPARAYVPTRATARPAARPASEPEERRSPARSGTHPVRSAPAHRNQPSRPVQPAPAPADPAKACAETKMFLAEVLGAMGVAYNKIDAEWDAAQMRVQAEVDTSEDQVLIGKDGKTLEALQFLVTLGVSRRIKTPVAVQVETAGYWKVKEESVLTQVHQAIEEVKRTGRLVRLQPMDSSLRRMIHRTLAESPDVETVSEGEGSWRKIVLRPKSGRR